MRVRMIWLAALGGGARFKLSPLAAHRAAAQAPAAALTGQVTSAEEGVMEGVLVSAKKDGSTITVTVVSDSEDGRFAFPAAKLSPGHYALHIRATGYELDGPQAADVAAQQAVAVDLELHKTSDLAAQLTSTEWLISMPGTAEQKRPLIECMSCHTLERILRSKYDADGFMPVFRRMTEYANNTIQAKVQKRVAERDFPEERARKVAEYLASVNLSGGRDTWNFPLKTLPRPSGAATKVVITEYDMPRATIAPHDVRTDANGTIWYSNFVENFLGRLDPKTGAHKEFPYPTLKPELPGRRARARARSRRQLVAGADVSGRARQVRCEDGEIPAVPGAERAQPRDHAAITDDAVELPRRRQGVDQRCRTHGHHAARPRERQV